MNTRVCQSLVVFLVALAPLTVPAYLVNTTSSGAEIKWFAHSTSFLINPNPGPSGASTAIQTAMNTWSSVPSADFDFIYAGATGRSGAIRDYYNVCSFDYLGTDGTIAQNTFWFNPTTGALSESDIVFNTYYAWSVTGTSGSFDVQNIATHELGHSLSLDDLYGYLDTEKTMYGYGEEGETKKRSLDPDDIAGISHLYPRAIPLATALDWSGTVTSGGDTLWYGQTATTHDLVDAGQSGDIDDYDNSYCYITVTGPGTISFWWKVSSEANYDFLRFYDNGTELAHISGEVGWQQRTFGIGSGTHQLKWTYAKDVSISSGSDAGWVDQVLWTPTISPPLLSIAKAGDMVVLSWGTNWAGFTLKSKPTLDASEWLPVAASPQVNGTNYQVTLPCTNASQFFRLEN